MSATKTKEKTQEQVELDPALTTSTEATSIERVSHAKGGQVAEQYEETGFEGLVATDFTIPFLNLLQKGSPQVEDGNPKQVPGAKAGNFMNSVTTEMFDGKTGIVLVPVSIWHGYLEWVPRDDGGGLQGVYDYKEPVLEAMRAAAGKRFGKMKVDMAKFPLPGVSKEEAASHDNNDLQEAYNLFAILIAPDGSRRKIVLGFASSQIPEHKRWMTIASEQTKDRPDGTSGPRALWSHRYRLTTVFSTNKKGSWFKYHVAFDGPNAEAARYEESDPVQIEAREFRALLASGTAKADFSTAADQETEVESEFAM